MGHAGTLDPMATGLLVLGLGRATRLLRFVQEAPKTYVTRVLFGVATDTLDADGTIIERAPMAVTRAQVEQAAAGFVGSILQVPPMVSAVKMGGRRLYEMARAGEEVDRPPRPVTIHQIEIVDFTPSDYPEAVMRVRCGSGTYVRTLADDIAGALGGRAHLTSLRRTRIGIHPVSDAADLETLEAAVATGSLGDRVVPPAAGLADLAAVVVGGDVERSVRHGAAFPVAALGSPPAPGALARVLDGDGSLLGVYRVAGENLIPEVVLA